MKLIKDKAIFNLEIETLKQQPIWSVRRSSAEYYMGNSLYILGAVSFQEADETPLLHYYVAINETLPGTHIPRWYPLNVATLYDNTLIDQVVFDEAEKIFLSQM